MVFGTFFFVVPVLFDDHLGVTGRDSHKRLVFDLPNQGSLIIYTIMTSQPYLEVQFQLGVIVISQLFPIYGGVDQHCYCMLLPFVTSTATTK